MPSPMMGMGPDGGRTGPSVVFGGQPSLSHAVLVVEVDIVVGVVDEGGVGDGFGFFVVVSSGKMNKGCWHSARPDPPALMPSATALTAPLRTTGSMVLMKFESAPITMLVLRRAIWSSFEIEGIV